MYVPDYIPVKQRIMVTQELHTELGYLLPGYDISLAISEGPFEDDDGVGAHFEAVALGQGPNKTKQVGAL